VALSGALYGAPASPDGNELVCRISGGGAIVIEKPSVAVAMPSATCAVKGNVPTAVGGPALILPFEPRVKPVGNEPPASDHV
jgi:hypothetical protein